jgi:hypothetical protein
MIMDFHYHHADTPGFIDELLKEMDTAGVAMTSLIGARATAGGNTSDAGSVTTTKRWPRCARTPTA